MKRNIATLLMAGALAFPVTGLLGGCSGQAGNQGQAAPQDESAFYLRWEAETHRDHRDIGQRNKDEQNEYQNWRRDHH
jgi:hypothetical protein